MKSSEDSHIAAITGNWQKFVIWCHVFLLVNDDTFEWCNSFSCVWQQAKMWSHFLALFDISHRRLALFLHNTACKTSFFHFQAYFVVVCGHKLRVQLINKLVVFSYLLLMMMRLLLLDYRVDDLQLAMVDWCVVWLLLVELLVVRETLNVMIMFVCRCLMWAHCIRLRWYNRVLEVALLTNKLHVGVKINWVVLRGQSLACHNAHIVNLSMLFFNLFQLLQLLLFGFLLFSFSINHIDRRIEMVLNLLDLFLDHLLHIFAFTLHTLYCSLRNLAHDFVENLSFKFVLLELVYSAKSRHALHIWIDKSKIVSLQSFIKVSLSLFCCVFDLFDASEWAIPYSLLVLQLSWVVEKFFQRTVKFDRLFNLWKIKHFLCEDLVANKDSFWLVLGAYNLIRSVLQIDTCRLNLALLKPKDFTRA